MPPKALSTCLCIENIEATRDFYLYYFDAKVSFDCGWYVSLEFGSAQLSLQFMSPRPGQTACRCEGISFNFFVDDVDAEHARLLGLGLRPSQPLEDHPWGDRSFSVLDPNGVSLCLYALREPTEEWKGFYKD